MRALATLACVPTAIAVAFSIASPRLAGAHETPRCIPIDSRLGNAQAKATIRSPGRYCLTEDLHPRIELTDRPAERAMIAIRASDVTLDLQGHTLGRGRLFKNPGGVGIAIGHQTRGPYKVADSRNLVIMNGTIQDFSCGFSYRGGDRFDNPLEIPRFDTESNVHLFLENEITVKNVVFKNNERDFCIAVPD